MKNNTVIKQLILLIASALFLAFVYDLTTESIRNASFVFLVICTAAFVFVFRKNISAPALFITMLSGAFLRLAYVIYTPVWCRQHDVIDFGAGEGHAAYMEYILAHKAIPDFDPRSVWAFFQPPLHHIIGALSMWACTVCGLWTERIQKNVQILPLMYMCILIAVTYLICKEIGLRKGGTLVAMLAVSFHPVFILMSGSINNDALSVMLTVLAFYLAIRWYLYPTSGKIVMLAIGIGLAMSAKLSAGMIAFPVGILMIYKVVTDTGRFSDRKKLISYLLELLQFAVIVIPLGLWWPIRNKILFDMPPGYIPEVGEHLEKTGFTSFILDVRTASPFLYMKSNGFSYDEYNIVLAGIKSSLFGEGDFAGMGRSVTLLGWILLFAAILLIVMQIIAMVMTFTDKEAGPDMGLKILLLAGVVSFIACFVIFAAKGKNLSAMDFRYSAAAATLAALFPGLLYDRAQAKGNTKVCTAVMMLSVVFAVSSCAFYLLIGII